MDSILMVGEDSNLLRKRAAALSRSGTNVTCCNTAEFDTHLWNETFDLVILCHTLKPGVQRSVVAADTYRRWPQARILQILPDRPQSLLDTAADADIVTGDMGEQGELIQISTELLGKSQQYHWRPLPDRFHGQRAS